MRQRRVRAVGRMHASAAEVVGKDVPAEMWLRKVRVAGHMHASGSECEGADELEFVPDSDKEGADDGLNSKGRDDEFEPDSQPPGTMERIGDGVIGVHGVPDEAGKQHQLEVRRPLGTMLHDWRRLVLEYEKPKRSEEKANIKKKKACIEEEKSIADAETDDEKPSSEEKSSIEKMSISDVETDDEGPDVRRHSQMKDDDHLKFLLTTMIPAYT
ncbi:hypothetical protein E2562_007422 [Oryza meyeriana var. granulata]|uniref:Uncharacterized protein n=1 Tax=Oryza meyeriana var. granulata TaxID=110450 RepID=A0A6G1CZS8_9ORYZ|nr:hypothetical protein E2562_007422 [Oryza meyeriana var. granulata]